MKSRTLNNRKSELQVGDVVICRVGYMDSEHTWFGSMQLCVAEIVDNRLVFDVCLGCHCSHPKKDFRKVLDINTKKI
jgi:hypothetical protein